MKPIHETIHRKLMQVGWIRALLGIVGFILSPLSWWNDLFVNFPIAYAFAWSAGMLLDTFLDVRKWLFVNLFIAGYFLSNLAGFLMIHYSLFGFRKEKKGSWGRQVLLSIVYSLVIAAFLGLDICSPEEGCRILPSWVEP